MSTHLRAINGSGEDPHSDAELMDRIDRALRSREAAAPDASVVAERIEDRLADLPTGTAARRGTKILVAGVVTSTLAVVGAGAAAAADPYSNVARAVENAVQAVGVDLSFMPDGYTRDQYDAFWGAGYSSVDIARLGELWQLDDALEVKARAGQLILDGKQADLGNTTPEVTDQQVGAAIAFWDAGYSSEDIAKLGQLWNVEDSYEVKITAGEKLLAGEALPIPPSGTPSSATPTP